MGVDVPRTSTLESTVSTPLEGTASAATALARVRYTHDAMIDLILTEPGISQNKLAAIFGYKPPWVSRVLNSDAFNARLAERKTEVVDPAILMGFDERLKAMAMQSLDIVVEKLSMSTGGSFDNAMKALELSTRALGYGAKQQNVNVQQNFVVALPAKINDATAWAEKGRQTGAEAGPRQALPLVTEVGAD